MLQQPRFDARARALVRGREQVDGRAAVEGRQQAFVLFDRPGFARVARQRQLASREALPCLERIDGKAAAVLATGAQAFASANPGCLVQIANALRAVKAPLPALHPIELVDASIRGVSAGQLRATARR